MWKHTEQSKLKMRLAKLGKKMRPEVRAKMIGRKLSADHKQHIKDTHPRYWFGKKRSEEDKEKFRISHLGQKAWNKGLVYDAIRDEKHPGWKGDDVGYTALHDWVRIRLGKPEACEHCDKKGLTGNAIHWANKSHEYKRELTDWLRLCVKCHLAYDKENRSVARKTKKYTYERSK